MNPVNPEFEARSGWVPMSPSERAELRKSLEPAPGWAAGAVELKRVCSWEVMAALEFSFYGLVQAIGDCVAWGAIKAKMAVEAYEIIRLGEPEKFRPLYVPWQYGVCRNAPEGGNGEWRRWRPSGGRRDGAMGKWVFDTLKYGELPADLPGLEPYSGAVCGQWGDSQKYRDYMDEAAKHQFKKGIEITSGQMAAECISQGYFLAIAGNREFPDALTMKNGKGFYGRGPRYGHQTSLQAYDPAGADGGCFYDSNQWPAQHAKGQTDGPNGGGWRSMEYIDREITSGSVECYGFSKFDGFPSDEQKPSFRMGGR